MTDPTSTIPAGAIVVGVDGSPSGDLALDWAARQASADGLPLVMVHAVPLPIASATPYLHTEPFDRLEADGHALLEKAAERLRAEHDGLDVRPVVRMADPRETLLEAATTASMLVVGDRGRGPIRQLLLGSVSQAVTKHAVCPVVVLRPARHTESPNGVLVGVAGDDHDGAVLDFAFRIARARDLPVTLLHCLWDVIGVPEGVREVPDDEAGYDDERALLADAARDPSARYPSVPVRMALSRGFADVQLIAASQRAELLVLGHRRKPRLRELVYGSVAPRVVEHAHCSAVIVPGPAAP